MYEKICNYFDGLPSEAYLGNVNNIKGILFEEKVAESLREGGLDAQLFEETNHPVTDILVTDDGDLIGEFQLKATDSVSYIASTLEENPDVAIIATHEVASHFENDDSIIDSGIDNADLTDAVNSALDGAVGDLASGSVSDGLVDAVLDTAVPISSIGIIAGLLGFFFF